MGSLVKVAAGVTSRTFNLCMFAPGLKENT